MLEDKNTTSTKHQILKVSRDKEFRTVFRPVLYHDLGINYECGEFLHNLFGCIKDLGAFIEEDLAQGMTYFTGNAHSAVIIPDNILKFKDDYDEFCYEIPLEEFLRINKEYDELDRKGAADIIFKLIDNKVVLEGFGFDNNTIFK